MIPTVWVLVPSFGVEGLGEPFMAFDTQSVAEQAKALIEKNPSATGMKIIEVPVWQR